MKCSSIVRHSVRCGLQNTLQQTKSVRLSPPSYSLRPIMFSPRFISSSAPAFQSSSECPKCSHHVPPGPPLVTTCPECHELLSAPTQEEVNDFSIFDIDLSTVQNPYKVNEGQLKKAFWALQQKIHPDMYSGGKPQEDASESLEDRAHKWSGRVNGAYKTLLNPTRRAEYLLELYGNPIREDEGSADVHPAVLTTIQVMEDIEKADSREEVDEILEYVLDQKKSLVKKIEEDFSKEPYDLISAKDHTMELLFNDSLEQACKDWEKGKPIHLSHV